MNTDKINTKNSDCLTSITHPQDFLVCVTIHKARNISILNVDTYVLVTLGKTTKATETAQNTDCPFYNEYFVFELSCSHEEMLRHTVTIGLYTKTCCAKQDLLMGDIFIDLNTVWNMTGSLIQHNIENTFNQLNIFQIILSLRNGAVLIGN